MRTSLSSSAIAIIASGCLLGIEARGQHSDINFDYESGKIEVTTPNVHRVGTGELPVDGLFRQFTENPGFASESDAGLGINPLDQIVYNVLGPLEYWDNGGFAAIEDGASLRIENNGAAADTVVSASSGPQAGGFSPAENLIGEADGNGEFHSHVDFFLEPNTGPSPPPPAFGAYGLKLSLATNATSIADSDAFYIVFNFGLDGSEFDEAVDAFASLLDSPLVPGDYNQDGQVGALDYAVWREQYGGVAAPAGSGADGNGDGIVDAGDYTIWRDNYGASQATGAGYAIGVPEPSGMVLLLLAAGLVRLRASRTKGAPTYVREESPMA